MRFLFFCFVFCVLIRLQGQNAQEPKLIYPSQPYFSWGRHIAADLSGNVYTVSAFLDTLYIDSAQTKKNIAGHGQIDLALCAWDCQGKFKWASIIGGANNEDMKYVNGGIITDDSGHIYVSVSVNGNAWIKNTLGDSVFTTGKGSEDALLLKMNPNGKLLWHIRNGGVGSDYGAGLFLDKSKRIWVTGAFMGNTGIYGTDGTQKFLTSQGGMDAYLLQYAPDGKLISQHSAGGPLDDFGQTLAGESSGAILMAGNFSAGGAGYAYFGSLTVANMDGSGGYVAKLNTNGSWAWVVTMGESGNEAMSRIIPYPDGSWLAAGIFDLQTTAKSTQGSRTMTLTSVGREDIAFIRINPSGQIMDAWSEGSLGFDNIAGLAYSPDDGLLASLIISDSISHRGNKLKGKRGAEGLLVKMDTNGSWKQTHWLKGQYSEVLSESFADLKGNWWVAGFTESDTFYLNQDTFFSPAYRNQVYVKWKAFLPKIEAAKTEISCLKNDSILIDVSRFVPVGASVEWYKDGINLNKNTTSIWVNSPGMYQTFSTNSCIKDTFSLVITKKQGPPSLLGPDRAICSSEVTLSAHPDAVAVIWHNGSSNRTFQAKSSGTYHLWQMDASGCETRDTVMLEFQKANAQFSGKWINNKDWEFLAADTSLPEYQWDTGSGWFLGSYKLQAKLSKPMPFKIRLRTQTLGGCIDSVERYFYGNAISYLQNDIELEIWPQPAHEDVSVKFPGKGSFILYQTNGQIVLRDEVPKEDRITISTLNLPSSLYYLVYISNEGTQTKPILIQHP